MFLGYDIGPHFGRGPTCVNPGRSTFTNTLPTFLAIIGFVSVNAVHVNGVSQTCSS